MIQYLRINNYAIIDKMNIELSPGLNIITGETGAGKSILLGATGLILGHRASSKSALDPNHKTIIEGVFQLEDDLLRPFFAEHDLDFDVETIIRREITTSGKSRAFINDTPVSLQVLGQLTSELVDIHQQFDTLELQQESFQLSALDALANLDDDMSEYSKYYSRFQKDSTELKSLLKQAALNKKEEDFLQFQHHELIEADVQLLEEESLESERGLLSNTEKIQLALGQAYNIIEEGEQPILSMLRQVAIQIAQSGKDVQPVTTLQQRLETIILDLEDWSREADHLVNKIESDPQRLEEVNVRLNTINKLLQKHQVQNSEQLLGVQEKISVRLSEMMGADERIETLKKNLEATELKLNDLAKNLTVKRKKASALFEQEVTQLLKQLHMENAILKIEVKPLAQFGSKGKDQVQFLFTANKGGTLQPIKKVASGGELSRLSLCIKSVVAEKMQLPTLIFDEIDAGISGEVALKMGGIIERLAKNHQILMITHSPQIASRASNHLFIRKEDQKDRTTAAISILDKKQRVIEIAKMLSGDPPSKAALLNAEELINT